jgi:transposase
MQDKELYEKLLGLSAPWSVQEVDLQVKEMKVTLKLTHQPLWRFRCPECDEECPNPDPRQRKWRHLDICGDVTMIEADVPRIDCPKHGVRQAHVPWAEPSGRSPPCLRR